MWVYNCNLSEIVKKVLFSECCRKIVVVKIEKVEKFEEREMKFENFNCDNGKFDIFVYVGFVEKTIRIYLLLDNGSNKSDCGLWNNVFIDSLDNILVKRFSNRSRRKKFVKFSDEESNICEYRVLDVNDIVVNVFKTEVYCMLCGIILFKL